jgi:hypothetical protein
VEMVTGDDNTNENNINNNDNNKTSYPKDVGWKNLSDFTSFLYNLITKDKWILWILMISLCGICDGYS